MNHESTGKGPTTPMPVKEGKRTKNEKKMKMKILNDKIERQNHQFRLASVL